MSGLTKEEMTGWRYNLKDEFSFWDDIKVISPPDYFTPDNDKPSEEKEAFVFDIHCIKKSDVVIVNLNKIDSIGTAQEVMLAFEYKKPIIIIASKDRWDDVHCWYKQEMTTVFFYEDYDCEEDLYGDVVSYVLMYA